MKAAWQSVASLLIGIVFMLMGPAVLLVFWIPTVVVWAAVGNWFLLPIVLLPVAALAGLGFAACSLRRSVVATPSSPRSIRPSVSAPISG